MINVKELQPSDISLILGMWEALLGGNVMKETARSCAEAWCHELKSGLGSTPKLVSSKWYQHCDLCLAVNSSGGVYARALDAVDDDSPSGAKAKRAAEVFVSAVASL